MNSVCLLQSPQFYFSKRHGAVMSGEMKIRLQLIQWSFSDENIYSVCGGENTLLSLYRSRFGKKKSIIPSLWNKTFLVRSGNHLYEERYEAVHVKIVILCTNETFWSNSC